MARAPEDRFLDALASARVIVFVCSGNMVRSAFAELYARHLACPTPVRSAATTFRNHSIFPETARALLSRGVGAEVIRNFRPTHLDDLLPGLRGTPLFLGMTREHLSALASRRGSRSNAFLLAAAAGGDDDIADPVLEGADFDLTFVRVARCVEALVQALPPTPGSRPRS